MPRSVFFWAGIVGLNILVGFLVYFFNHNPINPDGILYLQAAKAYQLSGFKAAFEIYPWPFYAVLIAILHNVLSLIGLGQISLLTTAFLLNNFFVTVITVFYLGILQKSGASRAILYSGAVLILCFPALNHYRHDVIRDTGYWAFLLASIFLLLCYQEKPTFLKAQGFSGLMACAFLFRIEAIVVWLFAPFLLKNLKAIFQHSIIVIALIIGIIFWKILNPSAHHFSALGRIEDLITYIKTVSFSAYFSNMAGSIYFLAVLLKTLSPFYALLIFIALINRTAMRHNALWIGLVGINFLIPLLFYLHSHIVAGRYLMACALLLLLRAPFVFPLLISLKRGKVLLLAGCIAVLSVMLVDGIVPFGHSKRYITEAGLWMKNNLPSDAKVYSNSTAVLFYAEKLPKDWQNISPRANIAVLEYSKNLQHYNYAAIRIDEDNKSLQQQVERLQKHRQFLKVFTNKRHDKVVIFYVAQ